ncbi:MAG: hypothetical protein IJ626_01360, partial [Muribaculaceae bacterium]|nr:hypothetical protein [Muribaculaceae bacterium]
NNLSDKYSVNYYPTQETRWEKMLKKYGSVSTEKRLKGELGFLYEYYKEVQKVLGRNHILCLMDPVQIEL